MTDILNEMCWGEKERMEAIPAEQLVQSYLWWSWHNRGHFSKDGTFIVKNYVSGGFLWYGPKCMREGDSVLKEELYEVAAKSMEGALAEEEEEDCKVEVVCQDHDSSSAKSVMK